MRGFVLGGLRCKVGGSHTGCLLLGRVKEEEEEERQWCLSCNMYVCMYVSHLSSSNVIQEVDCGFVLKCTPITQLCAAFPRCLTYPTIMCITHRPSPTVTK